MSSSGLRTWMTIHGLRQTSVTSLFESLQAVTSGLEKDRFLRFKVIEIVSESQDWYRVDKKIFLVGDNREKKLKQSCVCNSNSDLKQANSFVLVLLNAIWISKIGKFSDNPVIITIDSHLNPFIPNVEKLIKSNRLCFALCWFQITGYLHSKKAKNLIPALQPSW